MIEPVKPCPFCASTDIRFDEHPGAGSGPFHTGETVWSMCCYDCGATFPNRYRKELLVECWNRRDASKAQELAARVEKLRRVAIDLDVARDYHGATAAREVADKLQERLETAHTVPAQAEETP